MTVDKVKLKALAEAATQGEWVDDPSALGGIVRAGPVLSYSRGSGQSQIAMMTGDHWMKPGEPKANAAFIAAAGPVTVLALLGEIDQLKAENEQLRKDAERFRHLMFNHVDWARNGKDDDAVMLEFGPYPSHKLRETLDADMAKIIGDSQETISHA